MVIDTDDTQRSEAYRILSGIFFEPPSNDLLKSIREDFGLESKETEYEILDDFDALFLSPGGKLPPLESLYSGTDREKLVLEISDAYADAGLVIDEPYDAIPDHLSVEFLYMSYLIDIRRPDLQEAFLEERIMSWVPDYCSRIMKEAGTVFYREIAEIVKDFLESEYEELG